MDVRTLCLAALSRGGATGYEIKKMFETGPLANCQRASFGSIYPALARLVDDGLVMVEEREQNGRPDKRVHRLTDLGRTAFRDALSAAPEPETMKSDLLFMLLFASEMTPDHTASLIDDRIAELRGRADHIEMTLKNAGSRDAVAGAETQPGIEPEIAGAPCASPSPATFFGEPGPRFVGGYAITIYRAAADYMAANKDDLLDMIREEQAVRDDRSTRLDAAE